MWVAGFALFVLGIIFVIVAPLNKRKNARCSEETQGVLKDVLRNRNSQGNTGYTYIYSYCADGIEYQIKSTIHSKEADKVGDPCTIWYNPAKPKEAQPFRYGSAKVYNIILAVGIVMIPLGLILTLVGVVMQSL